MRFILLGGNIHIKIDKNGKPDYNIYKTDTTKTSTTADSTETQLKIELIQIHHSDIVYDAAATGKPINLKKQLKKQIKMKTKKYLLRC
jgi:hypothetical protein